jgi:hypothetical protein
LSDSSVNNNPYFGYPSVSDVPAMNNGWVLFVAYIWPSSYTGTSYDPRSGIYTQAGVKQSFALADFKWTPTATVGSLRTYLYYSTSTGEKQFRYEPRFEVADGTEPSLQQLLAGVAAPTATTSYSVSSNGSYSFGLTDQAGNNGTVSHTVTNIDTTAPTLTNTSKTLQENAVASFAQTEFTGVYNDSQNALKSIKIMSLPSHGVLKN